MLVSDIAERVTKLITEHLDIDKEKVTPEKAFLDDLGVDSLDILELVMAAEEEFGVEIPDHVVETIITVKDLIAFIEKNAV